MTNPQLYAVDLRDRSSKLLLEEVVRAWYSPTGHLVYVRPDGALFATPFDLDALEITGGPIPLFDGVANGFARAEIQLSADGTMLFEGSAASGTTVGEVVWVARSGEATPVDDGFRFNMPEGRASVRLAPDGGRIAYAADVDGNVDIWIKDLSDGATSRLTFREGIDSQPVWSPDGESITYVSSTSPSPAALMEGLTQIFTRRTDGAGSTAGLPVEGLVPRGWSPDYEWLLLYRGSAGSDRVERDILAIRPDVDAEPSPLLAREDVEELYPALSPDGRWIAYVSNETGQREIFVRPFPNVDEGQWQVSLNGGESPLWAHNGRELFFLDPSTREIKAADFTTTANTFRRGQITSLFTIGSEYAALSLDYFYDVGPDDDRFIMVRRYGTTDESAPVVILVQNFFEELERMMPD
jgi:serine/threonine-protein kinase